MLKTCKKNTVAFGVDECAALVIDGEDYKIVKSSGEAKVFKCYYLNSEYNCKEICDFGKINDLYQK